MSYFFLHAPTYCLHKGSEFGHMIASQLLHSFTDTFPDANFSKTVSLNTYNTFANKIIEAISSSVKDVLTTRTVLLY